MNTLNRRQFLKSTSGVAFSGTIAGCRSGQGFRKASQQSKPVNVLLIICDDLNDSVEGLGGHRQAQTPNMKKLMQRGVRFSNAHCNAQLCAPSRASLLTGLYPHTTGFYGYHQNRRAQSDQYKIIKNSSTIIEHFNANDTIVYGTGKIAHPTDFHQWRGKDGVFRYGEKCDFGPWPWDGKSETMLPNPNLPEPLDQRHWDGFGPLSEKQEGGWRNYTGPGDENAPFHYKDDQTRDLMVDERSAAWAAKQLKNHGSNQPFFMAVGFCKPHTPFYAPKEYLDKFPLEDIQLPPYKENDLEDCAKILAEKTCPDDWGRDVWNAVQKAGGEEMWKRWIQAYLACVAFVDDQVGVVLDALEKSGQADNTIVILTSDHGYHMGEKDHLFKNTLWSEATRVPLIIAGPGVEQNQQCCKPVSLIDIYPTLTDLCSLPENPNLRTHGQPLDGFSMKPLLENPASCKWAGPDAALSVLAGDDKLAYFEPGKADRQHFTIRTEKWRYILCYNDEEELYDHETDPNEWNNLAHKASYANVKNELKQKLMKMTNRI